ncbi:MAG TPA: hypothetical protein VFR37_15850 [Longimicrobium sp.]|nr:hypothetical protein [Longimicrobium sp.]
MSKALCLLGCTMLLHAAAGAVSAQGISFSSTDQLALGKGSSPTAYAGARLFSEDGRDFRFHAFGCEFEVRYPFQGSGPEQTAVEGLLAGAADSDMEVVIARLVNGRAARDAAARTDRFPCETAGTFTVLVAGRLLDEKPQPPIIFFYHYPTVETEQGPAADLDAAGYRYAFVMEPDPLAPGPARTDGAFALALQEMWSRRGR